MTTPVPTCPCGKPGMAPCWRVGGDAGCASVADPAPVPSDEVVEALIAENARLRKLVEPTEWMGWEQVDSIYDEARLLRRERDAAILERDEMRKATITPEDTGRPFGRSVEYWQDRALDYATALDKARSEVPCIAAEAAAEARATTLREVEAHLLSEGYEISAREVRYFAAHFNPEAE